MQTVLHKPERKINASRICIRWNICRCCRRRAARASPRTRKIIPYADFLTMSYLAKSTAPSLGYGDVVLRVRGYGYTITMQAEKPISTLPVEAGSDWWARGLRCKRSHREAHRGIGDLIDPDVYGDREDSIVPLVLIPISGCTSYASRSAWQRPSNPWLYMVPEPCPYIRYHW